MMRLRNFLAAISAALSLSACSSLNSLLAFEDAEPAPAPVVAAPRPEAAASGPNEWCQRVAASDRVRAQQAGFDAATLDRMTVQSYQQCVALAAH
jgi:hypothetical protein